MHQLEQLCPIVASTLVDTGLHRTEKHESIMGFLDESQVNPLKFN